ncbi:HtaA domain-containing protein [Microbacterium abyssi]|uniref:HtaA domain-containing protein n=1 Tax=Microbacterium abyssi TaxID=2782166 RepID=UPI001887E337|nr:HtaA domain-containing protein [Microbacterium sp. A18JL241]
MNHPESHATSSRPRAALAAVLAVLMTMFGTLTAPAALAAEGATVAPQVAAASESGLTIQVNASGLPEGVAGAYAALIVQGEDEALNSMQYVAFALPFPAVSAGSTSFSLNAPVAKLDRSLTYEVVMWKQHSGFTPENLYGRSVVSVSDGQWDAVFPPAPEPEPEPEPAPAVAVSVSAASAAEGLVVSVDGADFAGATGAYVALIEKGTESEVTAGGGFLAMQFVRGISDGAFQVNLTASADALEKTTSYEVIAWQQHTLPTSATIYTRADVAISEAQWAALHSVAQPSIEVFLADGATPAGETTLRAGDEIVVKGSGYDPGANVGGRGVPIPSNLPQGTYVVFGDFASNWQPSTGAASSTRSVGAQVWALAESVLEQVPERYQGAIRAQWVDIADDGTFQATLTLKDAPASPEGGSYGVFTYAAGGVVNAAQEQGAMLNYSTEPESGPAMTVTNAASVDGTDLVVDLEGAGFTDIPGVYAALIEAGTEADVTAGGGFLGMEYVRGIADGAFTTALTAAGDALDSSKKYEVIVWQQHTQPTAETIYARSEVTITAEQWKKLAGDTTTPPTTPPTEPTNPPTAPATPVAGGSLRWAISSTFVNYITTTAQGEIFVSGGATRSGSQFQFGQAAGTTYNPATGLGHVGYNGSVRFTGHHGVLDVTVSNPRVEIASATSATLYVTSGGARVPFATLNLAGTAKTTSNGAVTYTAAPATLTSSGRDQVLSGFTTSLNPVTFTIGTPAAAPNGAVGTVAAASVQPDAQLPSTPPASDGLEIDEANLEALQTGASATVTASGFQSNEQDIKVVVYSTPVLLGTVEADANGVATWTGALPATLADGEHTLTFQGSVDRGLTFTLDRAATTAIGQCAVGGATLDWGYKESFRNYIEGIAHGGWDLAGVAYEFPEFVWSDGSGSYDAESEAGLVDFGGTIAFHGHDGALDTKLNNARIELAGDTGYVVFDIAGTTQGGEAIDQKDVRFVEFSLADAANAEGVLTLADAATALTEAGAAAFGTYAAGESFDSVSFSIPVGADCGAAPVDEVVEDAEAPVVAAAIAPISTDAGFPVWAWIVIGLLVVGAGAGTGIAVQRRRAAASAAVSED